MQRGTAGEAGGGEPLPEDPLLLRVGPIRGSWAADLEDVPGLRRRDRGDAVSYQLGNELAAALESASDAMLALGHGLRQRAFQRIDTP